jgi:hypothetical protein
MDLKRRNNFVTRSIEICTLGPVLVGRITKMNEKESPDTKEDMKREKN